MARMLYFKGEGNEAMEEVSDGLKSRQGADHGPL